MPETASLSVKRLNVHEVANILGLNKYTVYKWARLGLIPCIRQGRGGRQLRFKLTDIEKWEEEQTTGKL